MTRIGACLASTPVRKNGEIRTKLRRRSFIAAKCCDSTHKLSGPCRPPWSLLSAVWPIMPRSHPRFPPPMFSPLSAQRTSPLSPQPTQHSTLMHLIYAPQVCERVSVAVGARDQVSLDEGGRIDGRRRIGRASSAFGRRRRHAAVPATPADRAVLEDKVKWLGLLDAGIVAWTGEGHAQAHTTRMK